MRSKEGTVQVKKIKMKLKRSKNISDIRGSCFAKINSWVHSKKAAAYMKTKKWQTSWGTEEVLWFLCINSKIKGLNVSSLMIKTWLHDHNFRGFSTRCKLLENLKNRKTRMPFIKSSTETQTQNTWIQHFNGLKCLLSAFCWRSSYRALINNMCSWLKRKCDLVNFFHDGQRHRRVITTSLI